MIRRLTPAVLLVLLVSTMASRASAQEAADSLVAAPGTPAAGQEDDGLAPRERYNESLAALVGQEYERAAAGFLSSRDEAGTDTELRFRAAFNLGLALARQSELTREEDPQQTIETLRQSAAWFRDAVRLHPEDEDSRINLELVLRRVQLLADELNSGQNTLRARLDRVIDDQRGLRDRVRQLLMQVEAAGAAVAPVQFQAEYEALAVFERTLLADTGTVIDLAGDELSGLENKTEEELTDEERVRIVQLLNLDHYLQRARQSLSDARRQLRRLEGDSALRRAGSALEELKRARDQLLDPVTVLKSLVEDQTVLLSHTAGLEQIRQGAFRLEGGDPVTAPPWLDGARLGERQVEIGDRHGELLARFQAAVESDTTATEVPSEPQSPEDAQAERMLAAAREAVPHLEAAATAMMSSTAALTTDELRTAAEEQTSAIDAMLRAIERFAALRELIELTYRDQSLAVALLTPADEEGAPEELKALSTEERIEQVDERSARNRERLERLESMLTEDRAQIEQQMAAQGGMPQGAGGDPNAAQQMEEQRAQQQEAIRERYEQAESYRQQAIGTLDRLDGALARAAQGSTDAAREAVEAATEGRVALEELRRLFFSVVEHLKELLRNQTETHDGTAAVQASDDESARVQDLGPLTDRQERHLDMSSQLAHALAEQADAAAQSQPGQQAEALAGAAAEVRSATGEMGDAAVLMGVATDSTGAAQTDLEPVLEHQLQAMEHLETAIKLLEPPSQQQQQQQQQPEEQISQRQAERRLQAIREREAERQRRREQQRSERDPVEKDW